MKSKEKMKSQVSMMTSNSLKKLIWALLLLFINARESSAQCNGPPLYLGGHNSSGHIAFPEANFDPESAQWQSYQLYPTDVTCTWVLRAPQDHILAAAFLHFDTEKDYDYVTLYADEAKTEQLLQVSGNLDRDYFVTSPDDTLVLEMISDDYTTYGGFLLAYRYEPKACIEGGVTIGENHLIAVPPRNLQGLLPGPISQGKSDLLPGEGWTWSPLTRYAPWLNCTWRLALDPRALLQIQIITFDTAPKDTLTIWQMNGQKSRQLLQYGGSDVPRRSFQSSKPLLVSFLSGNVDRGAGFLLNVTYIMRACEAKPQELEAPKGLLAYPLHNLQEEDWRTEGLATYGPDQCQWVVRAPHGYAINLTILHFDTLPDDQLQILDGGSEVFTHGGGMPSRSNFVSRGSELTLKFNPERDTDHTGFLIHYSWLLRECGGKLPIESGEVRSPYYPDPYGASVNCTWTLTPPQGHLVHLLLSRLRLDQGDTLQVMSGGHVQQMWGAGQGSSGHLVELRPQTQMTVVFTSDKHLNLGYFMLKYQSFRPGSCDFSLSPCGWQSTDPLQAWAFHGGSSHVVVQEQNSKNQQLPRGYRATLTSPWITPTQDTSVSSKGGIPMCFRLEYVLNGADAYLLTVTLQQAEATLFGAKLRTTPLVTLHGPHGNASLTAAVNITVTGNFQISIIYERGYGPHYQAAIYGVSVTEGPCGAEDDVMRAVSCNFTVGATFCAWANTHIDHTNWITDQHDRGLVALVQGSGGGGSSSRRGKNSEHQWADLVSPVFNRSQLMEGEPGEEGSCLTLRYQLLTPNSELRVLVKSGDDEILKVAGGGHELAPGEQLLWAQGRVRSPKILHAHVILREDILAQQYQLVLRAVGVGAGVAGDESGGGVAVSGVEVSEGVCHGGPSCDFDKGFCSWRVSYTGGTVWYIRDHKGDGDTGNHAAVLVEGGPGDTTALTSEPISADGPVALAFRYNVVGTSKCLAVALQKGNGKGSGGSEEMIWQQCRGKGHHWLEECIHISKQEEPFQVVIRADTGEVSTEVWMDDVKISAGGCNTTLPQEMPYPTMDQPPQWDCAPHASLCGMTQPLPGHRDWVYVYAPHNGIQNVTLEEEIGEEEEEIRSHSKRSSPDYAEYMDSPSAVAEGLVVCRDGVTPLEETWICDGIPDCPDAADEEDCECMSPDASDSDLSTCGNTLGLSGIQGQGGVGMRPTNNNPQQLGSGVCAEGAFRCPSGRRDQGGAPLSPCLPRHMVCDGVADCLAHEDEGACERMHRSSFISEMAYQQSTMVCSGGLNIPLAWRCDGIKDCPLDGLDEVGCAHCGSAEFICPTSGVCIPQQQVCDGAPSLPQCSDELMCDVCPPAHFVCDVCVTSWQICDGVWDCAMGEDERECHGVEPQQTGDSSGKCSSDQYRCPSGRCLPDAAVCDRHIDCPDGDDEKHCLDDNFDVERYISVKPSPVAGPGPWGDVPSRLLTPTLSHPQGGVALLQFIYRLDAWLGPSNATLSLEVVDAEDPNMGVSQWALWRQSGHKGHHWLKANLFLPYRPNMPKYKLAFLVSNDEHPHASQQLHIADISYRVVQPRALHEIGRSLLQCEFEDSFCGWSQITTEHGYSWVYARASPHTRRTGPITGYPDDSGSGFIFADSLHGSEGDVADLLSPPLMLPNANATICFRFTMFLYGAHVAKVSVAALQKLGGDRHAPHTAELFHAKGAKGLSWIPVALQITDKDLGDPSRPFVLVLSATRGIGPEADIALDHVSIVSGGCSGDPVVEPSRTLLPALHHDDVYALAAGPALMPQLNPSPTQVPFVVVEAPDDDPCAAQKSCSSCVTAVTVGCSWCDLSSLCVSDTTPHAAACPAPLHTQHNKSIGERSGPGWCPQLAPKQNTSVVVPARSSPVLAFPVINIQSSQMDSGWTCVYQFTDDDGTLDNDVLMEEDNNMHKKSEKSYEKVSMKKKEEVRMQGHYQSGSPGSTGVIKCGDGVTQLSPSHPRPYATVTLSLLTPAGETLDNPRNVHVLVYDCSAMASSCLTCLTLNSSLACGWCPHSHSCRPKSQCNSEWTDSICPTEEITTATVTTTTEASASEDLTEDLMEAHEAHDITRDLKAMVIEDMSNLLDSPEDDDEEEEEESHRNKRNKKSQKKKKKDSVKDKAHGVDNLEDDIELMGEVAAGTRDDSYQEDLLPDTKGLKTGGKMKKSGRSSMKGSIKVGTRGRAFLRLPRHPGIFVARDAWRLHTGRQYYVPVSKKTLINLGFVRQVTYGSLAEEKSRTVLINGAWKKAAGYFVDLFEKAGQDPVTSVVTTSRDVFEKLIGQLNTE